MKLESLSFKNNKTGWNIKDIKFDELTLLVGASGVGKTQILHALVKLSNIARGSSYNGLEWRALFTQNDKKYSWEGQFKTVLEMDLDVFEINDTEYDIVNESLSEEDTIIFTRDTSRLIYNGKETVKLDASKSAVELLKEESLVEPVYKAFRKLYLLETEKRGIRINPAIRNNKKSTMCLSDIKNSRTFTPIEKLFLLNNNKLEEFKIILEKFKEVFPLVENLDFALSTFYSEMTYPVLRMKEKGVDAWIFQNEISSGMYRSLLQIITLTLAEDGDVILIDEFENGLGVNCIDQLAELVTYPESNIQVIMTSHHPYIINTIPYSRWKIVTRKGCDVDIHTAAELKIGEHSKHDAFMQLIQTSAYKTGRL